VNNVNKKIKIAIIGAIVGLAVGVCGKAYYDHRQEMNEEAAWRKSFEWR
jgi:hypothetical protein